MPSITSPGIGSGLDVNSIVTQLMEIERLPLQRMQRSQLQYEAQISAYGVFSSTVSNFQTAMDKLSTTAALKLFTTSSSNENVVTIDATEAADIGTFGIEVVRKAEHHKMVSAEHQSTDTFGGASGDSLSIQVGADVADTITIDLSTAMTLSEIRTAINDDTANPGVTATIVNGDDGNQKLILTADESGEDSALTLSYGGAVNAASFDLQTLNDISGDFSLLDAEINIDGYNITRSSNTISDVISGVTINLVSADAGTTHTVGIDRDLDAVEEAVQGFADAFNTLRSSVKDLRGGQLEADSTLLSLERQVFNVLNTPASGGTYSVLSEIGLTMQKDGTMSLSSSDLRVALQNDFNAVAELFAADAEGFANRLSTMADTWLDSDGLIEARTDGLQDRIDDLEDRQISIERNLAIIEQRYIERFSALDALVGQLQGTSQFLTSQLSQLPNAQG